MVLVVEYLKIFLGVKCCFIEKIIDDIVIIDDFVYYFIEIIVILDVVW